MVKDGLDTELDRQLSDSRGKLSAELEELREVIRKHKDRVKRLVVRAPIIALDLYWRADAPLRIMTFSRGTWEEALLEGAG